MDETPQELMEKMQKMMFDLQEMINSQRDELSSDGGSYHRNYSDVQLQDDDLLKSEKEALVDGKSDQYYKRAAVGKMQNLEYTGKFAKDENGKVKTDEDGKPIKEQTVAEVKYEARNFNQWSRSINDLDEEERKAIQRKAMNNIHMNEDKIARRDIRTKIVNNKIEFVECYSEEESKKRFKFTRTNTVDTELQVPLCKFFINDELIYTMNIEEAISTPFQALETEYKSLEAYSELDRMDATERLCYEIKKKTNINILPEELYSYLDAGYLINGELK